MRPVGPLRDVWNRYAEAPVRGMLATPACNFVPRAACVARGQDAVGKGAAAVGQAQASLTRRAPSRPLECVGLQTSVELAVAPLGRGHPYRLMLI